MPNELDNAQMERIKGLLGGLNDFSDLPAGDLFISEHVVQTLGKEKTFVDGFDINAILGLLAFTPTVYCLICPRCITQKSYPQFASLVHSGLLIPVLKVPYERYPPAILEFLATHNHISCYEFNLWHSRWAVATFDLLDEKKAEQYFGEMHDLVEGRRNKNSYLNHVHRLYFSLQPYTKADEAFIEIAHVACRDKKLQLLNQLGMLGSAVSYFRSAQAFNASMYFRENALELPVGITKEADEAHFVSTKLREMAASGLGIRIPIDLPIETYIEIAKDYQPRIAATLQSALTGSGDQSSLLTLTKNISNINREIDRVKGLRRYAVLEACAGFYRNNSLLVGGALLASAIGLTTGILGCAATTAVAAGGYFAKKKKWLSDNSSLRRVGRIVARDVQPYTDALLKRYLGSTAPAIGVLSLQKRIREGSKK